MAFSACILINKWHSRLPDVLASLQDCSSELILGINGEFNPEKYPVLKQFPRLKIVPLTWKGYGATKNELAGKAQNDWILSIDADEVADEQLQESLQQIDLKHEVEVYSVKRANYLGETLLQHGAWGNHKKAFVRLYHRKFTQWNEDPVHEKIAQKGMKIIPLKGKLKHYTAENYNDFLAKNRHYAELSAKKYIEQGKRTFPGKAYINAVFNFIIEYLFQAGFLDGKAGWQVAKGNALYTYWKYQKLAAYWNGLRE